MKIKLKLINGWTKETVTAQVKKYNNGSRSRDEKRERCCYLTDDGNRCFVGCFLPDGHEGLYSEKASEVLLRIYPELELKMPFAIQDLGIFQVVHDRCYRSNTHEALQYFLDKMVE